MNYFICERIKFLIKLRMKSPHNLECFISLELEQDERESFTTPELWAERTLLVKSHFNIFNKSSEPGPQPYAIRTMAHGMRRTKIFRVENLISPRRVSSLRPSMLCFFRKSSFSLRRAKECDWSASAGSRSR